MNVWMLDRAVILARLIVWIIFVAGLMITAVPKRIRELYSFRANMLSIVPFSARWQKEIAPEHVDVYRKSRRWFFAGMTALLAMTLLRVVYFKFFFMRLHGFDLLAKNMALHVEYTALRPENDADKARAATLVNDLQHELAKYQDYHVAEAEGFEPFHPEIKGINVEFFKHSSDPKAAISLSDPAALLYQPTPDGGYKLVGAMYTEQKDANEDQLNKDIALSVARWHRDVNLCLPARGTQMKTTNLEKFGLGGSIATKQACDAVGGRFFSVLHGWTIDVHPWEQNPKLVWAQ
jgi:hypothetical protein